MTTYLRNGPPGARVRLVLAHGAGAPMDSPFMNAFAEGVAGAGFEVVRFEFAYMAARHEGRKPPPDREAKLLAAWRDVIGELAGPRLVIGGKSMGGRMASMVAGDEGVSGLVCLGYPFHAPGRPGSPRIGHLLTIDTPALIVQGTRDPFGTRDEVPGYGLSGNIRVHWIEDGDHDLKPRKTSGRTTAQNWAEGVSAVTTFLAAR